VPPDSIVDILTIDASGFELFGWPLIAVGFGIAVTVVWLSVSIAIRETERLIRSGA